MEPWFKSFKDFVMGNILYPSKAVLDSFHKFMVSEIGLPFKQKGYVAPTVFLQKGKIVSGWNYYNSLNDAFEKVKFMLHYGGTDVKPAGSVSFKKDGTAQTLGINVDFYFAANAMTPVNLGYLAAKYAMQQAPANYYFGIFRFFKTDGTGPYYSILDPRYLGITATLVSSYDADKIAALDRFHREAQLLKTKYNTLAAYLNALATKQLTPVQQQVFNEGVLKLTALRSEMETIEGLEYYKQKDGQIGIAFAIPLIAWLIIGAVAISWSVSKILTEYNKTARLNASYDVQKWVQEQKVKIAKEVTAGTLTKEQAAQLNNELNQVNNNAAANAAAAAKNSESFMGELGNIVKWAAIGLGVMAIAGAVGKARN